MMPQDAAPMGARALAESYGPSSPQLRNSRANSISSDRTSMTGYGSLLSPPMTINPEAIYIAASAASQIVTNDHDSQSDSWFDQHGLEPSGETALVAPGALKLVNNFLDQILFNFLSLSRSTSLAPLRPAVSEVLKPKLAKDAISLADGELQEYLGGGEDEELLAFHNGLEPSGDWDLELVWKRTRLRCMVYSSLGDMEEEDEDHYTELDQLDGPPGSNNRFSNNPGVVSPAVAIFLTSILEFMGEQVLVVAGQAAYHRLRARHEREGREGVNTHGDIAERVVVEETDMEKVALDRTLGRLWRGWKKRIRSPNPSMSIGRSFSRESLRSRGHSRINSANNMPALQMGEVIKKPSPPELSIDELAASVPLPIHDDDVREIEVPGLAYQSDDDDEQSEDEDLGRPRPRSLFVPREKSGLLTLNPSQLASPGFLSPSSRKRSNSLPLPVASTSSSPWKRSKVSQNDAATSDVSGGPESENIEQTSRDQQSQNSVDDESVEGEKDAAIEPIKTSNKGKMAGVFASAAAIGAAAVAGITAVAQGGAPETDQTSEEGSESDEGSVEEPQIMTSSRVSIQSGIPPEHGAPDSRPGSIRSQSVHSLRLVDVAPRSPTRSRHGSVGSMDQIVTTHPTSLSRSGSIHSYVAHEVQIPRGTSPISRVATNSPIARNGSALSSRKARNNSRDSISELEERYIDPPRSTPITPSGIPERSPLREAVKTATVPAVSTLRQENEQSPVTTQKLGDRSFALVNSGTNSARETTAIETQDLSDSPSGTLPIPILKTPESGVPALAPLREIQEGSRDASNQRHSYIKIGSPPRTSSKFPPGQQYTDPNTAPESPKLVRGFAAERNRVSPTQDLRDGEVTPKQETHSKTARKIHTSSSSTSSGSHKVRPIRTSEDNMPIAIEDKGKSFEQLIQSDQTIQYTLTPQNMRELESPESPRGVQPPTVYSKGGDRPRTSSSATRLTALHSHPSPTVEKSPRGFARPTANTGAKVRTTAPQQARDARVERDSIGDFAEFIRSTGPPGASYDDIGKTPASAVNGHRGQSGTGRNASTSSSPRVAGPATAPRRSQSSATRRLQAREAVVPQSNNSSDLIDFIRQGPPSEKTRDNPRIPRTVAPFRTTMDSDQMSGAVKAPETRADFGRSLASVSNEDSMRSVESSVTSQSGLLNNHASKKSATTPDFTGFDDEDMMPKRKTRRVKDPYAIDYSDEEDEFDAVPAKPASQEESLADFLRNVPPPAVSTTAPIFQASERPTAKKGSAPGLIARLSRNSGSQSKPTSAHSSPSSTTKANNISPLNVPISASKTTITQSSSSSNGLAKKAKPSANTDYVSRLDSERKPGKVLQKPYEPREAVGPRGPARTATSDLADFLRNTPPPPSNGPKRLSISSEPKEEGGGFARMFGRRKKAAAV